MLAAYRDVKRRVALFRQDHDIRKTRKVRPVNFSADELA